MTYLLKYTISGILMACLLITGCTKEQFSLFPPDNITPINQPRFVEYTIQKGNQISDQSSIKVINTAEIKFMVRFDSSAIYQTLIPINQTSINKLYGFSDNNANHHQFSARFGWRWFNNQLQIFAYNYNNGVNSFQQMGSISIGAEHYCSIKINPTSYVFTLNNTVITMPRTSTTAVASGYQLYPFFGGTETAPHRISIWIKDL